MTSLLMRCLIAILQALGSRFANLFVLFVNRQRAIGRI